MPMPFKRTSGILSQGLIWHEELNLEIIGESVAMGG